MRLAFVALVLALACGCAPPSSSAMPLSTNDPSFELLNAFRTSNGVAPLARVGALDLKAQAHAQLMADNGRIFHSSDLRSGIAPGWAMLGENVASAPTIEVAQRALEQSPPHRKNMLDAAFNQGGMGVVERSGAVYVVQFFVQR